MKEVRILPSNTDATISIRLDAQEKAELVEYAKKNDLTMSQVIRRALKEYLTKEQNN